MKDSKPKPPEIAVFAKISPEKKLVDRRRMTRGIVFGKVKDVARQYGIKTAQSDDLMMFVGPKPRLLMFVEKLHFSGIQYWEG